MGRTTRRNAIAIKQTTDRIRKSNTKIDLSTFGSFESPEELKKQYKKKIIKCPHCEKQINYFQFLKNLRCCPYCGISIEKIEEIEK